MRTFTIVEGKTPEGEVVHRVVEYQDGICRGGRGSFFKLPDAERWIESQKPYEVELSAGEVRCLLLALGRTRRRFPVKVDIDLLAARIAATTAAPQDFMLTYTHAVELES